MRSENKGWVDEDGKKWCACGDSTDNDDLVCDTCRTVEGLLTKKQI